MYDLPALSADAPLLAELRRTLAGEHPPVRLRDAKLKLTPRCNLRCRFCPFWKMPPQEELATGEVLRLVEELAELDCRKLHLSGGEPLLREDLPQLISAAAARGMRVSLTTNGTLLTRERAADLVAAGLRNVSVSLDSAQPALHDRLRGVKGAWKHTVKGLHHLARAREKHHARLRVRLNMLLTRHNYHQYPEVLALAGELGLTEVSPLPVDEGGSHRHRLLPEQLQEFSEVIAPAAEEVRRRYGFSTAPHLVHPFGRESAELREAVETRYAGGYYRAHLCYAPWLHTLVNWRGDVFPCCMTRDKLPPLGNVREEPLGTIFRGERYEGFRQEMRRERMALCHRCDNFLAENQCLDRALGATATAG